MATQSSKCDGQKNGTVDSVRRTYYKLCCYSNMANCGHVIFACENIAQSPFVVKTVILDFALFRIADLYSKKIINVQVSIYSCITDHYKLSIN